MKRVFFTSLLILFCLGVAGCTRVIEATDDSVHTANFYFYNYTNSEFFVKLTPTEFRGKQKFRIQKSDYIPVKIDDEIITEPDFSFEWIPGDFYLNITDKENIFSVDHPATLDFFTSKKNKIKFENVVFFSGVPSAQDFDAVFYVIETFCIPKMPLADYLDCINKITDLEDKASFEGLYRLYENLEDSHYAEIRISKIKSPDENLNENIYIKDYIRKVEDIVTKYDLLKGNPVFYFLSDEVSGDMDFELKNPDDYKYLGDD